MKFLTQAIVACVVAATARAATPEQWRGRSIYQLLTDRYARTDGRTTAACDTQNRDFCGGTWRGIINRLDYIQRMGFTAIWISPVTYNIPDRTLYGYGYHGFWQQDLYKLNDHFGTAEDLKELSKILHERGMYLMVDVVANHNGWNGDWRTVDYSRFYPFNDQKYFHRYCPLLNYSNQTEVEDCWLGDSKVVLPDLNTQDSSVVEQYGKWIKELVSNYSIDGLRVDTAKLVDKAFWSSFQQAAGVFCSGEVFAGDAFYTCDYQNSLDSVLNYPQYWPLMLFLNSTTGTSGPLLDSLSSMQSTCKDVSVLGTFSENHDLPRFASQTDDMALAKNVLAYTVLSDGIPIVYAGQEQHYSGYADPDNREATWLSGYSQESELFKLLTAVNSVRNRALYLDESYATYHIHALWNDPNTAVFRKGYDGYQIISVITNKGASSGSWMLTVENVGLAPGKNVVDVLTCKQITVGDGGYLVIVMDGGLPRVYFPVDAAKGSGICGL
ncbi:alpha-amylase [Lojkania enalia]|uniref:alpha-amylase n=1 Tax=Lojkania enalia TaxID=147567 RepID=A0A9P4K5K2_9PLEO|nr:alpha-amylase [Didymosphaeria enalia]